MNNAVLVPHVINGDVGRVALLIHDDDIGRPVHMRRQGAALGSTQLGLATAFIDDPQQSLGIILAGHNQIAHPPRQSGFGLRACRTHGGVGRREDRELAVAFQRRSHAGILHRRSQSGMHWRGGHIFHDVAIRQHGLSPDHRVHDLESAVDNRLVAARDSAQGATHHHRNTGSKSGYSCLFHWNHPRETIRLLGT
jgi:hypothetical protein